VTKTTNDAIAFFEAALAQAEMILGITWIEDLTDPTTGEIGKLRLVTDIHSEWCPVRAALVQLAA